jgi:hypothetical protein
MIILFQILFVLFALYSIFFVAKKKKDHLLGARGMVFWILFWLAVIIVVVWPDSAATIAHLFGIGRGADVVMYIGLAVLFFIVFRLHMKIEVINRDVTKVVREKALKH